MRRQQARSLLALTPALLVLAASNTTAAPDSSAAKTAPTTSASSAASPTQSICTPELAKITWSWVSQKKKLTNVLVRRGNAASKMTLVRKEDGVQPTLSGTPVVTGWIPTLADSLFTSKGLSVEAQPTPDDEAELARRTLAENEQSGTVVAFSGVVEVDASFTASCPGMETTPMSGNFSSWGTPTTGILHCSVTPAASTFAHLARQYCTTGQ